MNGCGCIYRNRESGEGLFDEEGITRCAEYSQ